MQFDDLRDLYAHGLQEMRDAEDQLITTLPRMAAVADEKGLADQFEHHLKQSRTHRDRLDTLIRGLGNEPDTVQCAGMRGLMASADRILDGDIPDPAVRDAALVAVAQKAEHLEMAGYGTLRTYAKMLGETEAQTLLQKTLDEEGQADHRLTELAVQDVNEEALV